MAEELLKSIEDLESYSFYGLSHWLSEADALLDQIDQISLSKAPKTQELALVDKKDELLSAQTQLRRQMGALLEEPLTRRERPKAEQFLEAQRQKLLSQASKERAASAASRLQELLAKLKTGPLALETKEVRDIEAQMKEADLQWNDLEPTYVKWQAGRHSFKSNAELQSFKRRYEDAKKVRDTAPDRLEAALRRRRAAAATAEVVTVAAGPGAGWAAARKAPTKAPVPSNTGRGAAAVALDKPKAAPKTSWTSGVTLVQRMRAEAAAQVRGAKVPEIAETHDNDFFWEETVRPAPPPIPAAGKLSANQDFVLTKSKGVPPLAPEKAPLASMANGGRRWGTEEVDESDELQEAPSEQVPQETRARSEGKTFAASAKKKGKRKKKGDVTEEDVVESSAAPATTSWVLTLQVAVANMVLEELLRRESWSLDDHEATTHLSLLAERLPLQSPLGFRLPFQWSSFLALEVDGGPKRRSRRGQSDALEHLRHNLPRFLPFYLTIVLVLVILHSLSHFGLLMWTMALQTALLLLPCGQLPHFTAFMHVRGLQLAHLLLWIFFVRSIWLMHIFIKVFCVALFVGHAYSTNEAKDDE
ncbi:unnamed protein product [Durusdinium trenchii]|uniref:Uncharacterized protein n=2 Tax=Durusdinium trenchii TaxID=1381693 RepID=A0ABP0I490_9DINO